jgi:O-antigen ligase
MKYLKIYSNLSILIVLIVPLLIWGPFLPDVIVSLSSLFFLIYLLINKNLFYLVKKPLIIFFIFCAYCILVSIFIAKDILLSFQSSLFYFRIGVFVCLICYLIESDKKILNYFYYILLACFLVIIIYGYIEFFYSYIKGISISDPHFTPFSDTHFTSFFGDEAIMGSYLSRLFPILFALFLLRRKNKLETYYISILFTLVDVLIYISGERTAFFFLNLSSLFIIIFIKKYQKLRLISFLCSLVIIVFLTLSFDKVANRMIHDTFNSIGLTKESKTKTIFSSSHDSLIRTAYNMFLDKPIFGHGPKMFRVMCKDEKYATGVSPCNTHPHNFYIQLLAETGIIGFIFLLCAFCYVLYCSYRQLKSIVFNQKRYLTDYQVCLLAGILITVWPFSPNGNFFNNWLAIVYSLPVGFYLHSFYGKNKKTISIS